MAQTALRGNPVNTSGDLPSAGSAAPDFALNDLDGKKVSLSDYRGKVVLLAFWGYG